MLFFFLLTLHTKNRKMKKLSLFISILLLGFSCTQKDGVLIENIKNSFGEKYEVLFNSDSSFALVKNPTPNNSPFNPALHFAIFKTETGEKVYEAKETNAEVKWAKKTKIYVSLHPGIISEKDNNSAQSYIYDVLTGKKK